MSQQNRGSRGQRSPPTINAQLLTVREETVRTGWNHTSPNRTSSNCLRQNSTPAAGTNHQELDRTSSNQSCKLGPGEKLDVTENQFLV